MELDRNLQHRLLEALAATYPDPIQIDDLIAIAKVGEGDEAILQGQLRYLEEHGLIEVKWQPYLSSASMGEPVNAKATYRCLDFLADDGGLSAILGVTVVKLHEQTLRDLIAARIEAADLSQPDKKKYLDRLRELPAESTKHLTTKLIDLALDKAPGVLQLLSRFLSGD
jgi:hypothetical protein